MRNTIRDSWNKECYKVLGIQQRSRTQLDTERFWGVARSAPIVMTTMMKIVTFPSDLVFDELHYFKKPTSLRFKQRLVS